MSAKRIVVTGRVQGVWFRNWTAEQARALGISGWVRNRKDGSLEILADGAEAAMEAFMARCRRGPPAARVDRLDISDSEEAVGAGFERRPSA